MSLLEQARWLYSHGQPEKALELANVGIEIEPHNAARLCDIAAASAFAIGDRAQAERLWRQAIGLVPMDPGTHFGLAMLLSQSGRAAEAELCFRQAIVLRPRFAEAHAYLGSLLAGAGRTVEAEKSFGKAISLKPKFAEAHINLGNLLNELGRTDDAERSYRRAVAVAPRNAHAYFFLGNLLVHSGRAKESEPHFREAIALAPYFAEAHRNLGHVAAGFGRNEEAEACYREAIAHAPSDAQAYYGLAVVLVAGNRFEEAEAVYRRIFDLDPMDGGALSWAIYDARINCSWSRCEQDERALKTLVAGDASNCPRPFPLLSLSSIGPIDLKTAACRWAEQECGAQLASEKNLRSIRERTDDRLRIGYLSADFYDHPVMYLFRGVLEAHDRSRLSVHAYSYGPDVRDATRQRVESACESFRVIRDFSDSLAASQIEADDIDILIDLTGYTKFCRPGILALRPARVLISWLGFPGTLGHPRMADYIIGDSVVSPIEHAAHFGETLALMPGCYQPNDKDVVVGASPSRQEAGLTEGAFVFCSFNSSYKINPELFDAWCRILRSVPGSVLWLLRPSEPAVVSLKREAALRGLDPERLVFAPSMPHAAHLGRLQFADLALDTFPYTSHTTGSDLLRVGVPLVTRIGETFASRVAASLLCAVGMPELVTNDWESYCALATELALNPHRIQELRRKLASCRDTAGLFDSHQFARDLERLYGEIWRQHEKGVKTPIVLRTENLSTS